MVVESNSKLALTNYSFRYKNKIWVQLKKKKTNPTHTGGEVQSYPQALCEPIWSTVRTTVPLYVCNTVDLRQEQYFCGENNYPEDCDSIQQMTQNKSQQSIPPTPLGAGAWWSRSSLKPSQQTKHAQIWPFQYVQPSQISVIKLKKNPQNLTLNLSRNPSDVPSQTLSREKYVVWLM